jgi:hypothetical protein
MTAEKKFKVNNDSFESLYVEIGNELIPSEKFVTTRTVIEYDDKENIGSYSEKFEVLDVIDEDVLNKYHLTIKEWLKIASELASGKYTTNNCVFCY